MKKSLQNFLLMAFLLLVGSSAWALTPDLSMDYELVGYKADAFYDFSTNDPAVLPESGDLKFRSGYGLFNFGSGNRGGDVSISVKQGQVLVCQFSDTQNRGVTINSISGCTKSSTLSDGSHLFYVADEEQSTLNFNVGRGGCIVSLLVMDEDQSVTKASYTLNYINGELAVKSVNGEQAVGSTVPTDASFFVEDAKYIRQAGEPESFTIAEGENNFSVKVRPAETFNYSLLSSLGETLASGSGLEGEKVYAGYPRYQLSEGKFYEAGVTNKEYRKSIVLSEDNINATVDYAAWDGSNPVVFFAEGENIAGFTVSTANNIPARASNAKAGTASEDVEITALPAGKYIFHVGTFTSKSSEQKIYIGYGENQYAFASSSNLNESASEEITLTEETAIKYFGTTSSTDAQFDYIWIEKTGEYVPVIYIVAGSSSEIFGQPWDPTYNANQMTMNANGTYSKTYTVEGSVDDVSLKVVRNGEEWFGDAEGFNVQFNLTGAGTFTVTFNPETSIVSVTGDIVEFPAVEYDITIADGIVGGTVAADPTSAKAGDEVTLTNTPAEGYEFVSYSVTGNHEDLAVEVTDGKFVMPDDDVTVSATFRKVIYIETDLTSDFAALTVNTNWKNIDGGPAGYTSTDFCPKVTTNAGQTVQVCEYYRASCDFTGDVLSQTVTGLTPGIYKIELYGGAAFTFNRGFGSIAFTGDLSKAISDTYQAGDKIEPTTENPTGVSLTATTSEGVYGGEIPIFYATNFPEGASVVTIDGVKIGQNGTITLAISKTSQSTNWHVIQLKGVTAQVPAVEALASAVAKAKAALNSEENAVIVGEERTALESAIEKYSEVTELTAEAYKTAVDALQTATNTFTSAREAYATLASTKETLVGYAEKYVYASADKAAAVTAAAEAVPTSAADATSINTNLITALRFMAESHAIAESVEGAEAIAITNPSAEDNTNGWTTVNGEGSNGSIGIRDNEPWTSADGSTAHKYFDGGKWDASAWDVSLTQDVELEPGKYLLSAIGRASGDVALSLFAGENKVAMPSIGAAGGIFNRGWNITSVEFETDAKSTVTIGVQGVTEVIHNWMSFSDFKLVCLERYYAVNIAEGIENGTVVADPTTAAAGDEVTLTVTPAEGYQLASLTVTGVKSNEAVIVTDGKFTMPADDVTVNATFIQAIYIETDLTSDFAALTVNTNWKNIDGGPAGYTSTDFCPKVTTNAGQTVQVCEYYRASCDFTGDVLSQTVTGLTPGIYKIELYGGAAFTFNRGFGSIAFTGDLSKAISDTYQAGDKIEPTTENPTGVSLTATTSEGVYGGEIPIFYATNFPEGASVVTIDGVKIGQNGTITLAISKTSQSTNWHVIQLKGVTAQVPAVEALASAVAKAKAALNSEENAVIVGEERTALESAIEKYSEVTELTAEAYKTAVDALQTATNTFTSAREAYATLASTKETLVGYAEKYVYASADKAAAVTAAAEAVPTSAADATSINTNLITALRFMAESHAIAESVEGAEAIAITNPSAEDNTNGWTTVNGEGSNGSIGIRDNEPWTSADGSTAHKYFDGGKWDASAWDVSLTQDVELEPGKYLLSAIGRASGDVALSLFAGENKVAMPSIGAAGGIFNRGWNITSVEFKTDAKSTVTIGVQGVTDVIHNWMSFSDFKLVCLERYYAVNIAEGIENGTVVADPTMAAAGETVTLTVTPAEGYELASVSVTGVTSEIAVETTIDEWTGEITFDMPADAVTVNVTFQEAYVKLSDYAAVCNGIIDEDGSVEVAVTFTPELKGSYEDAEAFANKGTVVFTYNILDENNTPVYAEDLDNMYIPNDKTIADGIVQTYVSNLIADKNYTLVVTGVHVYDYYSAAFEIFTEVPAEGQYLASATFTTVKPFIAELNVERYVGQGYTSTVAEVDFSAAEEYLGVNGITSDMIRIVNPDETTISDYAKYDGWFATDGTATTWDDLNATEPKSPGICVKFYQAIDEGKYAICDMNGADVVDNTYTVRWAIEANDKVAFFNINVKFVPQPVIYLADYTQEGETVDVNIYANTGNVTFDGADSEAFQESAVSTLIGEDWEDVYGVGAKVDNQETMTDNYSCYPAPGFWCLADGTADQWANGTFGVSLIWDDSFSTFNFRAWTKGDISDVLSTTFYLVNNNTKKYVAYRVILNTVPTGIDATPAADGVKPDGKYLENGKIVIYRNGNKYDASGAPMNK